MKKGKFRKAIFAVTYTTNAKGIREYLILKRKWHWTGWEFPKGKIETGESLIKTVKRELREETGIIIRSDKKIYNHKIKGEYLYPREIEDRPGVIGQTYNLFSIEVKKPAIIKLDALEHNGFKWVNFDKAIELLTHGSQRKCLRIVEKSLKTNNKK